MRSMYLLVQIQRSVAESINRNNVMNLYVKSQRFESRSRIDTEAFGKIGRYKFLFSASVGRKESWILTGKFTTPLPRPIPSSILGLFFNSY